MPRLYDVDSDNSLLKHANYQHDGVQDAMQAAQSDWDFPIKWETELSTTRGYDTSLCGNVGLIYVIEE